MEAEIIKNLQSCQLSVEEEEIMEVAEEDIAWELNSVWLLWRCRRCSTEALGALRITCYSCNHGSWGRIAGGDVFPLPFLGSCSRSSIRILYKGSGVKLAGAFKESEVVEIREKDLDGQRFFRLRIRVDVSAPLRILVTLRCGVGTFKGLLSYERLPNMCFGCGKLGHLIKECATNSMVEGPRKEMRYGIWIKSRGDKSRTIVCIVRKRLLEVSGEDSHPLEKEGEGVGHEESQERSVLSSPVQLEMDSIGQQGESSKFECSHARVDSTPDSVVEEGQESQRMEMGQGKDKLMDTLTLRRD
ncbi:hypothetical protein LIER_10822 [Lithospermum erythrorhizon]|uniref:CCHC-type domain-containing protein n=1 Tax=Lithospermum erythrorhizon TaxID=34254 RepID=A0AAV3PM14_LITER